MSRAVLFSYTKGFAGWLMGIERSRYRGVIGEFC
jgi:hypothetical protein